MPAKKEIEKLAGEITSLVMANRLKEALTKLNLLMEGMHVADFTLHMRIWTRPIACCLNIPSGACLIRNGTGYSIH
jgi:hypothetical protein